MAESLIEVDDPLLAELDAGNPRPVAEVVRTIHSALALIEAPVDAPGWLRPEQVAPFRRTVAALDRYRCAMLADPVGSGKSYIALAVAVSHQGRLPVVVLAPAVLRPQWLATAARHAVEIVFHSHEQLSRGNLPSRRARLVIVDESHRFRNPGIARYRHLAHWLSGKPLLLLTATPVVNRLDDLAHQLLLGLRRDALAFDGLPDLLARLQQGESAAALGNVILCRPAPVEQPRTVHAMIPWQVTAELDATLEAIGQLALSTHSAIAALLRVTLWRALSSSVPALVGTLERYLALLDHARHAADGGRRVTRAEIRQFTSSVLDQLVMWDLLPTADTVADLVPTDRGSVEQLLSMTRTLVDPRLTEVMPILQDPRPTIVFTGCRDTLRALRGLAGPHAAWICGSEAGIGHTRMPAATVLDWFRPTCPNTQGLRCPHLLLATDVAAEGLDLQRAERILHFDLPWTPMRLDQREGRVVRLGSRHDRVDVQQWAPWPALETQLRQAERLLDKRHLIRLAGLDEASHWLFRWRSRFTVGAITPCHGAAAGKATGWLAALAFDRMLRSGIVQAVPAHLIWFPDSGEPIIDPALTTAILSSVHPTYESVSPPDTLDLRIRLAEWTRARLRTIESSRWQALETAGEQRRLIRRLQQLAREAGIARNRTVLAQLQQAIEAIAGGLNAGEASRIGKLIAMDPQTLIAALQGSPFPAREDVIVLPRLRGLLRITFPA